MQKRRNFLGEDSYKLLHQLSNFINQLTECSRQVLTRRRTCSTSHRLCFHQTLQRLQVHWSYHNDTVV